jgi:mRNA-degrading endonuclease toxin of MazEF toxin-antitoxin module
VKRGSLYWINFGQATPPEFGKARPALILSNSVHNLALNSVVVLPLSTQAPEIWPLRLKLQLPKGKTSFAVVPGIRQVSKARLRDFIGLVTREDLERITEAVSLYLED